MQRQFDLCVVGGCGRVGLPLAIAFASAGLRVAIFDINNDAVQAVRAGQMPFNEEGAQEMLRQVQGSLEVANDPTLVADSRAVIIVIGTPVDEHLNPTFSSLLRLIQGMLPHLHNEQMLVLRSTLYPGTTDKVAELLASEGLSTLVSFCPERIAEGRALVELRSLPQIVSGTTPEALLAATKLFSRLTAETIALTTFEAELAKLFTNSWRYIQFAAANQFYMMANACNANFYKIYDAMRYHYPRTEGFPRAGFVAGPCLFKDTMQLAALSNNNFFLGHAAMLINEGLPSFLVAQLKLRRDLKLATVGILGMGFKADIDDGRDSLSYKLRRILEFEAATVVCHDPFLVDQSFVSMEEIIKRCDILILGAPHLQYQGLIFPEHIEVVDVWNFFQGTTAQLATGIGTK